ncbi:MAG: glutamate racemase [Clostridiales Family XIII bacterium]|jgi:glutamate racemase|nr:glutamate racemase [Clostridiales Family XIII bacterium]
MDNRPIGFFDSGLGGLTCIPYLLKALPRERITYFGDTARTPYGSKTAATIRKFASEIADFLIESQDVKMVAIACNTVSAIALDDLRQRHPKVPILGIISPAAHTAARGCAPENRIGVIGTKATIASGAYTKKILGENPALDIYGQACPAFVPLIEEGIIQNHIMDLTIRYYLDQFIDYNEIDTLVLGCTHYPLIRKNITKLYPGLRIIDPSEEILTSIDDALTRRGLHAEEASGTAPEAEHVFYASDLSENFVNMINLIFSGTGYRVAFRNFDLEAYIERKR